MIACELILLAWFVALGASYVLYKKGRRIPDWFKGACVGGIIGVSAVMIFTQSVNANYLNTLQTKADTYAWTIKNGGSVPSSDIIDLYSKTVECKNFCLQNPLTTFMPKKEVLIIYDKVCKLPLEGATTTE